MGAIALTLAMGVTDLPRALAEYSDGLGLPCFTLPLAATLFCIVILVVVKTV